jgi:hypothetical protein
MERRDVMHSIETPLSGELRGRWASTSTGSMHSKDVSRNWMHTGNVLGMDLDDICAYTTPKVSIIRDWKLGAFNRLCTVCIAIYIGVFVLYFDKGYLNKVTCPYLSLN